MKRVNLMASLIILLMAGVVLGWLIPEHVPSAHDAGDLPPTMVPVLSMTICAAMAFLLGISAWRRRGDAADKTRGEEADGQLFFGLREAVNLLIWLAATAVIWLILKYIGFVAAATVTIAAGTAYGGIRNLWIIIPSALIIPLLIDKIVWYGLSIRLP
jgi:hypothetical protein